MALVMCKPGDVAILDGIRSAGSLPKLKLFKNDVTPDVDSVLGDLDEADFDGYTTSGISWAPAFVNGDGKGQLTGSAVVFLATGGGTPNDIYGAYVVNNAEDTLLYAERFPAPISIVNPGDFVFYQPSVTCVTE